LALPALAIEYAAPTCAQFYTAFLASVINSTRLHDLLTLHSNVTHLVLAASAPSMFGGSTFGAASSGGGLFGGASTPAFGAPSAASPFGGTSTPAFGTPGAALFLSVAAYVMLHVEHRLCTYS
jgi:hypothetical protein